VATVVKDAAAADSADIRFAAAVAAFGMLLRDSEHRGTATFGDVLALAKAGQGDDPGGYRAEFVELVEAAQAMSRGRVAIGG
jgi:Ca-activated chloride channel family protein